MSETTPAPREYQLVEAGTADAYLAALNAAGQEGWRVVSTTLPGAAFTALLERPRPAQPPAPDYPAHVARP